MVRLISIWLYFSMAVLCLTQLPAEASFITIGGIVKDKDSKKAHGNVSISLENNKFAQ